MTIYFDTRINPRLKLYLIQKHVSETGLHVEESVEIHVMKRAAPALGVTKKWTTCHWNFGNHKLYQRHFSRMQLKASCRINAYFSFVHFKKLVHIKPKGILTIYWNLEFKNSLKILINTADASFKNSNIYCAGRRPASKETNKLSRALDI